MHPKDVEGIANSVDPETGAVSFGSALFAQTCLSKNLGKLRYAGLFLTICFTILKDMDRQMFTDWQKDDGQRDAQGRMQSNQIIMTA